MDKRIAAMAFGVLLLTSSVNAGMRDNMSNLKEGMSRKQVISQLGKPDGFKRQGGYESMEYNHRLITGWTWDRADYHVILKDGQVVEYGMGEVRVKNSNVLFLVPLNFGR